MRNKQTKGWHFSHLYNDLYDYGSRLRIGGNEVVELTDYLLILKDPRDCLTSFRPRNLNLPYCKREWLWYLNGDRYDDSITKYASLWKKIKQADGGFNSNYGQYIFGEQNQFEWVVDSLLSDIHSRQACIQLLNHTHMYEGNSDVVCTMSIQFLIRRNRLNMTVHMRSNDAIWGLTNDVFCFAQLHQMVYWWLIGLGVSPLELGTYKHIAGSMHVYERHFDMLEQLVFDPGYYEIDIPPIESHRDFSSLMNNGLGNASPYTNWMLDS